MAGESGLEGLHAIATFYDELGLIQEGEVQDVGNGMASSITHDDIMESVQRAMLSALGTMEGRLGCQELEVMEQFCSEGGDISSQVKIATFHAFCHHTTILQAVTEDCTEATIERSVIKANQLELEGSPTKVGFLMKHIWSILWLIGLKADVRQYYKEAGVWLKGTLYTSGQLTGLRRGWCFHLRYALGNTLYQVAFNNCDGNSQMQSALLKMALPELVACAREIAQESELTVDHHEDAVWALTTFGKVAKVIIKLQQGLLEFGVFRKVQEVYNEVAIYARKLGRKDLERLLSQLCSGLSALEEVHKRKLEADNDETDETDEELDEKLDGRKSAGAGFKMFVEVLKCSVEKLRIESDDFLESFDLLSHACWWTKESMRSLAFEHLTFRFQMPTVEEHVEAKLEICMLLLGMALTALGEEEEGLYYLEITCKTFESDSKSRVSLHDMQKVLARAYGKGLPTKDHRKAAEMYEAASKTARDLHTQLVMDMDAASQWIKVPEERVSGMEKIQAAIKMALEIFPCEWVLQAFLFFQAGMALQESGDEEGALKHMETGINLCLANNFSFTPLDTGNRGHVIEIVIGFAQLLVLYLKKENLAAALALHKAVSPILVKLKSITGEDKLWKDTAWRIWQQALELFREVTGTEYHVNEESSRLISWDISELMLDEDIGGGYTYRFAIADHFQNLAKTEAEKHNWKGAVYYLNVLEEKLRQRGVLGKKGAVILHSNRASFLHSGGDFSLALEEIRKATDIMQDFEEEDLMLVRVVYFWQSRIFWDLQDADAAHASLDKAEKACVGNDSKLRDIRYWRGYMWWNGGQSEMAEELAREIALSCADAQSKLGIESAWVGYLENTSMALSFFNGETICRRKKDAVKALIWAERGRARLYMHRTNQLSTKEFDQSDQYAEDIIFKCIELCGPNTVILECTIMKSTLVLYGLFLHPKVGEGCFSHDMSLDEFFKVPTNCVAGMTLDEVVFTVRKQICRRQDEIAMLGLSVLHSMLVQSMLKVYPEAMRFCTNIIFAPQGKLHLIPFMALYDGSAKKFLIEQKAVSVIPSIRSLHHCFARQQMLENRFQVLDGAFIAGNPKPMGAERLLLKPLPGAAEEAQQVAKILGVKPCKEENITKEVVVKALATNSVQVVLLATHGLTEKDNYPSGAVVLRSARLDNNNPATGLDSISHSGNSSSLLEQQEVLTSEELANIKGGISAGLVVLSACHSGEGEVSREGLLSLGHALLQAGASSALVNLWAVDDGSMAILIADVFKELRKGTNVLHSVQKAVVDMLRGPEPRHIQDWAALTLLGSPSFQLPIHMQDSKVNPKQDNLGQYNYSGSQLSADDIGGSTMYMRAVVHHYQDWARQQHDEGNFEAAIAIVSLLESKLQKNGLLSTIAKCKLHLWRASYMNHLNAGTREALKELQKAVRVLPDFDKTPDQLVAAVFLEQARAYIKLRDSSAASAALDRALESVTKSNDSMLLYHSQVFRSFALSDEREFKSAASLVQEAQLETSSEGVSAWIPFVDDAGVHNPFSLYEMLSFGQGDVNKAVVWAEQGRSFVSGDDVATDSAAASNMLKAVALCGPNTLIIKFSYHHQSNFLMLYGLSSKVSVCSRKYLKQFFNEEDNCVMGTNLVELVSNVRHHISTGEDEVAVLGLAVLYKLLVTPILAEYKEFFDGYTKIIFAPQGFLCQVPFAALYDASGGKFLVEQMAVGVIPSLRSLQCCFSRQHIFESSFNPKEHSNAFVGGNYGDQQLPGAGETAQEVAGILDVEPCPETSLTKEALLEALSTCDIVMLATLAVGGKREQPYPYRAMVLKKDTALDQAQVLTCEEIGALAGMMRASLVVTIACHKGQQDQEAVNRDGLLGLGHAALEAGAVSVIVSLWDVNDEVLKPLVSSVFRELKQGSDVLFSMQKSMKDMVRSAEIRHWASLTVLGSPSLCLSTQTQTAHQPGPAVESQNSNAAGTDHVNLDTVRMNCLRRLNVVTDMGPLHALPQEICDMVLQNMAEVQNEKMKEAEQEGGLVGEIMGCGYLGTVYGAMGEWSTARRWLVRSLSVAKENWECVKDNLNPDSVARSALYVAILMRLHSISSLNFDLDLIRFVLRCTDPTDESLFGMIHQVIAIWE